MKIDCEISTFLDNEKFATIAYLQEDGAPYCFNCMYLFNRRQGLMYFKSSPASKHAECIQKDNRVSGSVLPVRPDLLALKGVQFAGNIITEFDHSYNKAVRRYHLAFPLALTIPGKVFVIKLEEIKLTDNSFRFGKKFIWKRENTLDLVPVI